MINWMKSLWPILLLLILSTCSVAYGVEYPDTNPNTLNFNWAQIAATVLGGGGLFAFIKYILDFRLGGKAIAMEDKKLEIDSAAHIRKELTEIMDRMEKEIESLRQRVGLLETTLSRNNIPLPYYEEPTSEHPIT
jgi:hypothetical protein